MQSKYKYIGIIKEFRDLLIVNVASIGFLVYINLNYEKNSTHLSFIILNIIVIVGIILVTASFLRLLRNKHFLLMDIDSNSISILNEKDQSMIKIQKNEILEIKKNIIDKDFEIIRKDHKKILIFFSIYENHKEAYEDFLLFIGDYSIKYKLF